MDRKFKIGDKVEIINYPSYNGRKGRIYKKVSLSYDWTVKFEDGSTWVFYERELRIDGITNPNNPKIILPK